MESDSDKNKAQLPLILIPNPCYPCMLPRGSNSEHTASTKLMHYLCPIPL